MYFKNAEQSESRNAKFPPLKSLLVVVVACLIIVKPGPDFSRSRLGLVRLLKRSAKDKFDQVGCQVSQVKDQVGQGKGQELDNM